MKRITLTIMAALLAVATIAHAVTWQKTFDGGNGYCVQETLDSNYIISASKMENLWLFKTDTFGNIIWERIYGGTNYWRGKWVEHISNGGYIIASRYPTLLKADKNGDTIWTKDLGAYSYCAQETSDSGFIVVCGDNGNGGDDLLILVRTNPEGETLWTRTYGDVSNRYSGFFIQETSDSGFIITGHHWMGSGEEWSMGLLLTKTDSQGDIEWSHTYGGLTPDEWLTEGLCVRETSDGCYIICGSNSFTGFWLLKADENGDTLWTRTYGGDYGSGVLEATDGNYVAVGRGPAANIWERSLFNGGDVLLVKVNPQGNAIWERYHGGDGVDAGDCVTQTLDGGYIITGWSGSFNPVGLYLLKTDSLGFIDAIAEEPIPELPRNWEIASPIGSQMILRYWDMPQGFHASVFDVSGRKIDKIHATGSSGSVAWGVNQAPGIYFIQVSEINNTRAEKVVIIH